MSPLAPTRPRLEYGIGGPSSGPALVFVNGLGGSRQAWYHQVVAFNRSHRVLTYDHRGIGHSELVDAETSCRDYARDLMGLLNHVGIYRAVFVGVSFGGRVVQELTIGWPGRVVGQVLVGTSGGGPRQQWGDPEARALLRRSAALTAEEWLEGLIPHLFGSVYQEQRSHRLARLARWWADHPQHPTAITRQWQAMEAFDRWDDLPSIQAPTLVLQGAEDSMSPPANGRALAERIPAARLVLLEGVGHSPQVEDPDRFGAELAGFLEQIGPSG